MSESNPFSDAMDEAAEEQEHDEDTPDGPDNGDGGFDVDQYYDQLDTRGQRDHTIGIAVTEEMNQFYSELKKADDVDVDPAQSIRNHLEDLARRHPEVFERAMRKLEIDREY
ncbi:hypothetical protein C475_08862 [Halosimplex carlsbadense 2-9-1]|uniref:Uncharacterized protein n=1 Tax=Halosimplex carlsbadense 2-9-1 TaxID=797114 RepID=M0CXD2_9EURY|nr:hypothetical protein [Halosimplex carlsbadense]ELZ26524.1 hypothetical protein C475_08862 [Halosimplex carlsbadense 2-9-1]